MTAKSKLNRKAMIFGAMAAVLSLVLGPGMVTQQAFAHALNIQDIDVEGAGNRGITIVLGHTNEPTFGAKPGIHDGKHGVEVFLEDRDTALPITGAELQVDKYFFKDFNAFKKAKSVRDATERERGVELDSVFGDPGHYLARQVQKDGIYGYRLYGTIHYFGVEELDVDATVFCRSPDGPTTKFNSPGWFGGFGCTDDIDDSLFPERNSDVNKSRDIGKASFEVPSTSIQQVTGGSAVQTSDSSGLGLLQMVAMVGLPAAAIAGVIGFRSMRKKQSKKE
jgi:hypothetical protein